MNLIVIIVIIICAIPVLGALYELFSSAGDVSRYFPSGDLVDIGGHRLHIDVMGESSDRPTVICDSGVGSFGIEWKLVQEKLADQTQVVVYDRAGNGWSDKAPITPTTQQIAQSLHMLLQNANVNAPYILVGHGIGGVNIRKFAELYPNEVAGLVLVDATNPKHMEKPDFDADKQLSSMRLPLLFKRFGLLRLISKRVFWQYQKLPEAYQDAYVTLALRSSNNVRVELGALFRNSPNLPDDLGNLPIAVLSRSAIDLGDGETTDSDRSWHDFQTDLVTLSTNSTHIISEQGGRYIHVANPDLVVTAIQDILEQSAVQ